MSGRILIVEDEPKLAALLSDYLQQAGFEASRLENGLELVMDENHNTAEALSGRRKYLAALLADLGLEVPSFGTALFWRYNLASQDDTLRRRGLETVESGCRVARAFGARVFLVVAGLQEPGTEYARSYETAVASMRRAASYAADAGILLGIENVPSNFLCRPGEYAQFIADVDHPAAQAYLDVGNGASIGPGYPENWITAMRGLPWSTPRTTIKA